MTTNSELSEREREILRLIATGATNQRIANDLSISVNTVKVHIRNTFGKIGAASRAEAVMYAVRMGVVPVGELSESVAGVVSIAEAVSPATLAPESPRPEYEPDLSPSDPEPSVQAVKVLSPTIGLAPMATARLDRRLLVGAALAGAAVLVAVLLWALPRVSSVPPGRAATPTASAGVGQRWRPLAPLPSGRAGFGFASYAYDGKQYLYLIGGESGSTVSNQVLRYDPSTDTWVAMSAKPTAVTDMRAAVVGSRIYVPGGRLESGAITGQLEAYDPQRDRWTTLAPLPQPRDGYALAAVEGKLYLLGGWDGKAYRADVWQYNPDDDTWRVRTAMPTARAFAAVAVLDQWIHVAGGENQSGSLSVNERYFPAADDGSGSPWSTKAPLLSPVARGDAAAIGGLLMVVGVDGAPGQLLMYIAQTDSWRSSQVPLDEVRSLRVQAIGNRLYLVGGNVGGRQSTEAFEYQAISTVFVPVVQ